MPIALFTQPHFPIDDVAAALRRENAEVMPIPLDTSLFARAEFSSITKAVLVMQEQGIIPIGEKVQAVRNALPRETPLRLCINQPTVSDRQYLLRSGVEAIITPGSWNPGAVAERILAELIIDRHIEPASSGELQGATGKMREIYRGLKKVAPLNDPVLILGESGTGKELVAREVHRLSGRTDQMLTINCAELSPELLASELFGHERGAFTGAVQARKGLIAVTGGGDDLPRRNRRPGIDSPGQAASRHRRAEGPPHRCQSPGADRGTPCLCDQSQSGARLR